MTIGQLAGSGGGAGGNTTPRTINLFDLSADWGEGTVGASSTISGGGQGGAAQTGDATWNARMYSATTPTNWTIAGGDFSTGARATLTLSTPTVNTTYTWSSANLIADVQTWLNTPASNHGWELINADETTATNFLAFYSKDGLTAAGNNSAYLPQIVITYAVPEPGPVVLIVFALLALSATKPVRRLAAQQRRGASC